MISNADSAFAIAQLPLCLFAMAAGFVLLVDFLLLKFIEFFPVKFVDFGEFALEFFKKVGVLIIDLIIDFFVLGVVEYGRFGLGCGFGDAVVFYDAAIILFGFLDDEYF